MDNHATLESALPLPTAVRFYLTENHLLIPGGSAAGCSENSRHSRNTYIYAR
jgi:hypothetical protein